MNDNQSQSHHFPKGLAKPALRALSHAGITSLEQLTLWSETELGQLHGIGPKASKQLSEALHSKGLTYKQ